MASYNQWLSARQAEYSNALTGAKAAFESNPTGSAPALAYSALYTLAITPANDWSNNILTALVEGTAEESEINLFQNWLSDDIETNNGIHAGALGLTVQTQVDTGQRQALGSIGVEGGTYRRWKGQPLYTFGEGVLIGKDNQIVAVFGDHPEELSSGFGTDGLIFFDGKPMSKNSETPGTVVFGGDLMVSGSIRGDGGVVIIDDVIQLETGVVNPAGIALSSEGKILLRHRGEGFDQFIDPALTQKAAEDAAKIWISEQNTNATKLTDNMVANGNFDIIEYYQVNSEYKQRPAGPVVVGNTNKDAISYPTGQPGILKINPDSDSNFGFVLPAIDVSEGGYEGKYSLKLRFSSDSGTTISANNESGQGLSIYIVETDATAADFDDAKYVYLVNNDLTVTAQTETRPAGDFYDTNTTFTNLTSISRLPIPANGTWDVQSFSFTKQSSTNYVSILIVAENMGGASLFVDYVWMKPAPPLKSAIEGLITQATGNILDEVNSLILNATLTSLNSSTSVPNYFSRFSGTGTNYPTMASAEGDNYANDNEDSGVSITANEANTGIVSQTFQRDALVYTVGARIKATTDATTYRIFAVESPFATSGNILATSSASVPVYNVPTSEYNPATDSSSVVSYTLETSETQFNGTLIPIRLAELQGDGTFNTTDTDPLTVTKDIADGWHTVLGTYKPTRVGFDSNVRNISIGVEITSETGSVVVDFIYVQRQTTSTDIAGQLADEAYADAQEYLSVLNSFVAKEQGSLIPNAQMGVQEFVIPSGAVLATQARPSGFKYIGYDQTENNNNGNGYLLSYADTTLGLGKDAVMKIDLDGNTNHSRGVLTPAFPVSNDKYAIIVRAQKVNPGDSGSLYVAVNSSEYTLGNNKSTIGASSIDLDNDGVVFSSFNPSYETDVQITNVNGTAITLDSNTLTDSMVNYAGSWFIGDTNGDYESVRLASLSIIADCDFYIDYVYVVAQTVSFRIAGDLDNAVRNFFNEINELSELENDSLIGNGNFTIPSSSNLLVPAGWYPTSNTEFKFVQDSDSAAANYVASLNGNGTVVGIASSDVNTENNSIVYSGILNLPNSQLDTTGLTDSNGTAVSVTQTEGNRYTVFAKCRTHAGTGNNVTVSLKFHEYNSTITNEPTIYESGNIISGGVVSDRTNTIDVVNITDGTDDGFSYENILTTSWVNIGGTYIANPNAKHVSFSIELTWPGGAPTIDSSVDTFFYVDYFYVGSQTLTADIAAAIAKAEADIVSADLGSQISGLEINVELEDPSLSLITNSTFVNYHDDEDAATPHIAKHWVATRSTKTAVELFDSGTDSITSIGTHARPYNATNDSDNSYGMLSKMVVEPALAVTQFSFANPDDLAEVQQLGSYNILVRCRGDAPVSAATSKQTVSLTTTNWQTSTGSAYRPNFLPFTDSGRTITDQGIMYYEDTNPNNITIDWTSSINSDIVYFYFGFDTYTSVYEGDEDLIVQILDTQSGTGQYFTGITVDWTSDGVSWSSWSNTTVNLSDSSVTINNLLSTLTQQEEYMFRISYSGQSSDVNRITFNTTGDWYGEYVFFSQPHVFLERLPANNSFSVQILAHEKLGAAPASGTTHIIDSNVSITTPQDTNAKTTIETFTNNNSDGVVQTLTAIDLLNTAGGASTEIVVNSSTESWRNILATYTPNPNATAVSFEFLFDSDKDASGDDSIVYVDSVHMEISTTSQDLVIALANERAETAEQHATDEAQAYASEAQRKAAAILASLDSEAWQVRNAVAASMQTEQGSIMYNSSFAHSYRSAGTDDGGTATTSGINNFSLDSSEATLSGTYVISITSEGKDTSATTIPDQYTVSRNGTTLAGYPVPVDTAEVYIPGTGVKIAWNRVTGGVTGDSWTYVVSTSELPIGYRLGNVGTDGLSRLSYQVPPSQGNAKIRIDDNAATNNTVSLFCPPVIVPNDGGQTDYQVAVKVKGGYNNSIDDVITLDIIIHELYDYLDTDTYTTFAQEYISSGTTKGWSYNGITYSANSGTSGISTASGQTQSDVYLFEGSDPSLSRNTALLGGLTTASAEWPIGTAKEITVVNIEGDQATGGNFDGNADGSGYVSSGGFSIIAGGFSTAVDTKVMAIELRFRGLANNTGFVIIDFISVSQSTLGEAFATSIAETAAQAEISTLLDGQSTLEDYLTSGNYTQNGATSQDIIDAKTDVIDTLSNMKVTSLQPNGTFANRVKRSSSQGYLGGLGITGDETYFPAGYTLHQRANVGYAGYEGSSNDRRKAIVYADADAVDDPKVRIDQSIGADASYSLVCPYILKSSFGAAGGLTFAIRVRHSNDTDWDMQVFCHQIFSDPTSSNGQDTGAGCTVVLQGSDFDFTDTNGVSYSAPTADLPATNNDSAPDALFFQGIDPAASKASAINAGASGVLGTKYQLYLIDLLNDSDTTATFTEAVDSTSFKTIGGSCIVHPDAVAVSFEIHFSNINTTTSYYIEIDEIAVNPMDVWVDIAHLTAADRVLDIVEDIEEENAPTITNVILNPKGDWSYPANSRYTVPRNWRYLGEQPFGIGYRTSANGSLLDKPLPRGRKLMSLGIIGERGIAQRNGSNYINQGMVSKPWRVEDDVYEWEIEFEMSSSGWEGVRVFVLEYDSTSKPQWLKPHYAKAWNTTTIDATTMYGGGIATVADRQVCLHHNAADSTSIVWDVDDSSDNNGVKYDAGNTPLATYNITETTVSSGTTTISSDQKWLKWNNNGRSKYEGTYIPTDGTKYAALWICTWSATSKLVVYNVEMNTDKTSSNAIDRRRAKLGAIRSSDLVGLGTTLFPAGLRNSGLAYSALRTQSTGGKGSTASFIVNYEDVGNFTYGDRLLRTKTLNNSNWGLFSGSSSKVMDEANIIATDNDLEIPGTLTCNGGVDITGVVDIYPASDSQLTLRIHSHQQPTSYWGIYYDEEYLDTNVYNVLRFYYYKGNNTTGTEGSGGYLRATTNVTEMTFTGQHRNRPDDGEIFSEKHIGLIVVSTGKYRNLSFPNSLDNTAKPTINESLPYVALSTKRNDKACWGVISEFEDPESQEREHGGAWVSVYSKEEGDNRTIVNSLGEGAIWVCNINGDLENGDYITTCEIPGHGMRQDDDLLHNYTVAKITQDCTFELDNPHYDCVEFEFEGQTYRKAFVGCTYHCG